MMEMGKNSLQNAYRLFESSDIEQSYYFEGYEKEEE
jgi:hypothetical protein